MTTFNQAWPIGADAPKSEIENYLKERFAVKNAATPVIGVAQSTPPASPATADAYIVGPAPTGAFSGHENDFAEWDGSSWVFSTPAPGSLAINSGSLLLFENLSWVSAGGAVEFLGMSDTPSSFAGNSGKIPSVNAQEDALEFVDQSAGGGGIIAINTIEITGDTTYTPPTNLAFARIECIGGGGGGGGSASNTSFLTGGGGGGGGSYAASYVTLADIGASKPVTVGSGGVGSVAASGTSGGATSFGALVIAAGGGGGSAGSSGGFGQGGVGSDRSASSGGVRVGGQNGTPGPYNSGSSGFVPAGGVGGASMAGSGARAIVSPTAVTTHANDAYANSGGGGGGGMANYSGTSSIGGNGGSGIVVVTEYIK